MRLRTSAALALVMALLASPAAALACGFDCWPAPPPVVTAQAAEALPAEGDCHRDVEEPVAGTFTLSATPHDCSDHSALDTGLATPKSSNGSAASVTSAATLPFVVRYALSAPEGGVNQSPVQDLAPPGRSPDLIAPLRI